MNAIAPATVTVNLTQSGGMSAPPGYTSQQMIFDDRFSGTSLDSTKWVTYLGQKASGGTTTAASPRIQWRQHARCLQHRHVRAKPSCR